MSFRLGMPLVLASGAAFVAVGVVALWRSANDSRRLLEAESRKLSEAAAQDLRRALLDPATLELAGEEQRFTVEDGRVVVAREWLVPHARELPFAVRERLRRAAELEFVGNERPRAREALAAAAADLGSEPAVSLAGAWCAERDGDAAARDALLATAEPLLAGMPGDAEARSWLLLAARAGRPWPAWAGATLRATERAAGAALLLRLEETAPGADRATLAAELEAGARRREVAAAAARRLPALLGAGPAAAADGTRLVLWYPSDAARGAGLVAPPAALVAALADRGRVAREGATDGTLVLGPDSGEHAVTVLSGALALIPSPLAAGTLGGPFGLMLLLAALALCTVLGSWRILLAQRRESKALAARAEFLTSVTHELKTPVTGMLLLAEMFADGKVREHERAEFLQMLRGEAARLSALIANVLDLGRAERGERAWDRRPLDLGALVADVLAPFRLAARREGIELESETTPHEAVADRDAIAQALLNLLDNARKYAADGKRIAVRQRGGRVEVRDYGPGVPEGERERIFEKLRRGEAQQDGHVPGLGLGLHLAREIARAHGGSLRHEPPADGGPGACFVLELP